MKNKVIMLSILLTVSIFVIVLFIFTKSQTNIKINYNTDSNIENSSFYKKYYESEKITVVNIWATWCVPCIEEVPKLNQLKKKYEGYGVNFISFSLDKDIEKLKKFNLSKNLNLKMLLLRIFNIEDL